MSELSNLSAGNPIDVAIVGGGLIGSSWAALFSASGHSVRVFDPDPLVQPRFMERLHQARADLARLGPIQDGAVIFAPSLSDAVGGAALVQECGPEAITRKRALLSDILAATDRDPASRGCPVVSSTSALPHADLVETLSEANAHRIAIGHPFNPPHLVPLVEIFSPDDDIAAALVGFYRSLGREPVRLRRSLPAHGANRLATALWREAVHLVAEGVADVEEVDNLLRHGPGFRWRVMGPFLTYHLGGGDGGLQAYLDHLGDSQEARWQTLGSPSLDAVTRRKLVDGMSRAVHGRSVADLQEERDEKFIEMLRQSRGPTTSPGLGGIPATTTMTAGETAVASDTQPDRQIGPAEPDDSAAIATMIAALAEFEGKPLSSPPSEAWVRDWLFGPAPVLSVLVARNAGQAIGYLAWFRGFSPFKGGATLMIENLYIAPRHRGHGLGRALMAEAARTARKLGIDRLELTVRGGNDAARQSYIRFGFRETAEEILRIEGADIDTLASSSED